MMTACLLLAILGLILFVLVYLSYVWEIKISRKQRSELDWKKGLPDGHPYKED